MSAHPKTLLSTIILWQTILKCFDHPEQIDAVFGRCQVENPALIHPSLILIQNALVDLHTSSRLKLRFDLENQARVDACFFCARGDFSVSDRLVLEEAVPNAITRMFGIRKRSEIAPLQFDHDAVHHFLVLDSFAAVDPERACKGCSNKQKDRKKLPCTTIRLRKLGKHGTSNTECFRAKSVGVKIKETLMPTT